MNKFYKSIPPFILVAFLIRLLITSASFGDALVFLALSALYAGQYYLIEKKQPIVNKDVHDKIDDLAKKHKELNDKITATQLGISLKR